MNYDRVPRNHFPLNLPYIPGQTLCLDASSISGLSDGDPVGTWLDKSGNDNNATQTSVDSKPLYKVNQINGKPIIRFDGVNDRLSLPNLNDTSMTVIVVGLKTSGDALIYLGCDNFWGWNITSTTTDKMDFSVLGYAGALAENIHVCGRFNIHNVGTGAFYIPQT